jgi:hypothetical protein
MQLTLYLVFAVVFVLPFWQIFRKAGFHPALSLIMLIPVANLVALYFFAFSQWPSHRG